MEVTFGDDESVCIVWPAGCSGSQRVDVPPVSFLLPGTVSRHG
jgi:hypothetical protein